MSNLLHIKGSRTKVLNTFPTRNVGNDGDIIISRIKGKGVYLCSKAGGTWYTANKLQELRRHEKNSITDLSLDKLTLPKLIDANKNADKFLVSDSGIVKYRTGDEVFDDLGIPINNIDYKTAYCSLGQYSDKDTCEANDGTWYYSENDSHDSISSTAENELLTVSQSIGNVDAESTLTYDGSVFQIKKNSDYDDNWYSLAQEAQIRFHDGTYHTGFKTHGTMTADSLYTLPAAYPGANKVLQSDTSGNLTWVSDVGAITALNSATATELVTVGATTTELDAHSGLTFNGKTLTIEDNNALTSQLILRDNGAVQALFNVDGFGTLTISTAGSNADITLQAQDGCINFKDGSNTFGEFNMNSTLLKLAAAQNYALSLTTSAAGGATQDITLDSSKDIVLDAAADIVLDSGSGDFIAKKSGTEFSADNSAYAGMILGYTVDGNDLADQAYNLTTSYVVFDSDLSVTFKTPPSEKVEIQATFYYEQGSGGRNVFATISDNTTYGSNTLHHGLQHEKYVTSALRGGNGIVTLSWNLVAYALEAIGSSQTIYFGAKCDSTSGTPNIKWGGNATGEYQNFVMRAIALPA